MNINHLSFSSLFYLVLLLKTEPKILTDLGMMKPASFITKHQNLTLQTWRILIQQADPGIGADPSVK